MSHDSERDQERPIEVVVASERRGLRVSLKLAVIIQLIVISSGIGGTYVAVRAGIDADHQRIQEITKNLDSLKEALDTHRNVETQLSGRIDNLNGTISYLSMQMGTLQEELWKLHERR